MKKNVRYILTASVVTALLAANTSLASAAPLPAKPLPLNVLPQGQTLTEDELANVKGEGLFATIGGAIGGGLAGFGSYAAEYVWDTYVQDEDTSWDWGECGDRVVSGIVGGAIGATVSGWWAP